MHVDDCIRKHFNLFAGEMSTKNGDVLSVSSRARIRPTGLRSVGMYKWLMLGVILSGVKDETVQTCMPGQKVPIIASISVHSPQIKINIPYAEISRRILSGLGDRSCFKAVETRF